MIAANDERAVHILRLCRNLGIRVPGDLAVMGIDNEVEQCETAAPTLTSVAIDWEDMGNRAAEALATGLTRKIAFAPPVVVARESTDERLSGDALVRRARELINTAHGCNLKVSALAAALNVPTRTLHQHFAAALNRSPLDEINRVRLDYLKTLLRNPALTRTTLAERCGFSSTAHLAYFFRLHTNQTIDAFRESQ